MKGLARLVLLVAVASAIVGCGRKAALDTPYQAAIDKREEARKAGEPLPPVPEEPVADKPFILDWLL